MPQRSPRFPTIDGFEFAAAGGSVRGAGTTEDFPRLRELLHDGAGSIRYELHGWRDALDRCWIELRVEAKVRMTCRRCLEAVDVVLDERAALWLAGSQAELDEQPLAAEGPDGVVASREMAVKDLVEDQLLLALPYAPRHDHCTARGEPAPGGRQTPFAGLRGALGGKVRH